ncbi:AIPR family protein [Methanobrevibacter sp.]|uniref:AIPR family protein n=1 Tax=Methanobrevibacter sp. TaxID=66852 RepID=UPI00386AFD49
MMDFEILIHNVFKEQDDYHLDYANASTKISALYVFYHYLNADVSRLDEVWDALVATLSDDSFVIKSVLRSNNIDDAVDFNSYLKLDDFNSLTEEELCERIKGIAKQVGAVVYHDLKVAGQTLVSKYDELQVKLAENTAFVIRIVCPFILPIEQKIHIQQIVSEIKVTNTNVMFEIIFGDDLEEEVSDVESPKEYVPSGSLGLINNSICYFGEEESFVTIVSAKSLKQLFLQYSTRGLFASNLRFYITNKKIDGKIVNTIQNEPENFCYFNNGIIVTCDNYELVDGRIRLSNFSIVNGGQTTNLIGRTSFDKDFGVICKVIKNKYDDTNERIQFLSKVAEASNMQKPINAKDLIANKPEQRLLKIQFAEAGMFLKVKRGEKIDKSVYPEAYMNASNDEVAQLLYSYVFQAPGTSKNGKSSLIGNEKTYNLIFKNSYSSDFFKSMQIIKVAYADWQKKINKSEPHSSVKYGLSRHANYMTAALIGFYLKVIINSNVRNEVFGMKFADFNNKNLHLKSILKVNDIGTISLIKHDVFPQITKSTFFGLFDYLFEHVLIVGYQRFKKSFPTYAFSHFCKSDSYYYDFVLAYAKHLITSQQTANELLREMSFFNTDAIADVAPKDEPEDLSAEGLEEELKAYRTRVSEESGKTVKSFEVFKNMQIAYIVKYFPADYVSLSEKCNFTDEQISLYGDDVIAIVKKYIKIEDFE